jgi:hypothetical protein
MCNDSSQGVPATAPAAGLAAVQQPVAAAFGGASATRLQKEPAVTSKGPGAIGGRLSSQSLITSQWVSSRRKNIQNLFLATRQFSEI